MKVDIKCDNCGMTFERYPSLIKDGKQFCGRKCKGEWRSKHYVGENGPGWRGGDLTLYCAYCGRTFTRSRARYKGDRNKQHFCGMECYAAWRRNSGIAAGENNPRWVGGSDDYRGPNWEKQRQCARQRDQYRCRHCGISERRVGYELAVHHIRPFREFGYVPGENENYKAANDLANLITLCRVCHGRAETGKIPVQPWLL